MLPYKTNEEAPALPSLKWILFYTLHRLFSSFLKHATNLTNWSH